MRWWYCYFFMIYWLLSVHKGYFMKIFLKYCNIRFGSTWKRYICAILKIVCTISTYYAQWISNSIFQKQVVNLDPFSRIRFIAQSLRTLAFGLIRLSRPACVRSANHNKAYLCVYAGEQCIDWLRDDVTYESRGIWPSCMRGMNTDH